MNGIWRFAAAVMLLAGCGSKEELPATIPGNRIALIGHGGMGKPGINNPYQLNSYNGLLNALDIYRMDGVETDIQLSRDSALFMIHDDYLDLLTYCSGCIANADSAFIASCSFRPISSGQFRSDPVTPLEKLFALAASRRNRVKIFLDIHPPETCIPGPERRSMYAGRMLRALERLLSRYRIADRVAIQCGDRDLLAQAEAILPEVERYLDYCSSLDDVNYARSRGYSGVAGRANAVGRELIDAAHDAGLKVQLYDAGSQRDILAALSKLPDYFLADNLVLTQQIAETVKDGQ